VIDREKVCVIVPFFNEEQVIYNVISELIRVGSEFFIFSIRKN
jgi:glycosyltransferase involved in cell wall biosynthesis